jgi:hypothetical protein
MDSAARGKGDLGSAVEEAMPGRRKRVRILGETGPFMVADALLAGGQP